MTPTRSILLACVALPALAGCAQSREQIGWSNHVHTQITAREVTAELKIDSVVSGEKLGDPERAAVKAFATAYEQEGKGKVVISRPSNGPSDVAALRAAADARAVMLAEGVDPINIAEGPYDASGARQAPLLITYTTYETVVPGCPDISSVDIANTSSNSALPSFGCAVNVSLAAMIADPSDLVGKQHLDPSDLKRRSIVLTKYRNGEVTGAAKPAGANGQISTAVGN
jgi:pilus assembly protein CpaD